MLFYKCLKDKAMNIEINQYSYLSPKKNYNKQKGTILDATLEWFSYFRHTHYKNTSTIQSSIFSTSFISLCDKIKT